MNTELWEKAAAFHGHKCPGLAIGVRAAEIVLDRFSAGRSEDEELVCVTENDACGVDGVQAVLGCTFGKGNLLYRPTGKQAFSFFDRKSGQKLRLCLKPFHAEMDRNARMRYILEAPEDEVFSFGEPSFALPEPARLFKSLTCELCGESAPEHKMRLQDGKTVCLDCFKSYDRGW
jgi:formylmethanofuran dehydrogenase subunit E